MLHILFFILKIIGVILLVILGILILGIICVLFVPVRYRIEAVRLEGEEEPPVRLKVQVTWLLHMINLLVRFDGRLFLRARLFIVTVFKLPKQEKADGEKKSRKKKGSEKAEAKEPGHDSEPKEVSGESASEEALEEALEVALEEPRLEDDETDEQDHTEENRESGEKPSFFQKLRAVPEILRGIFAKIKSLFTNIQYTIQKFCDKIGSVLEQITYYREILEGEPFKRSLSLCRKELLAIARSIKPDQFEVQMLIGLDDPAATGEVLAVCGMLYPVFGGHVDVAGDFEKKRLEGRIFVKGKLRFFTFLRVAVKIYFNKDIKKLIKLLKKEAA